MSPAAPLNPGRVYLLFSGLTCTVVLLWLLMQLPLPLHEQQKLLLRLYELPRFSLALLCGGAMGLAGLLIQQVIRNPFASPSTLGINAGAMLGVTLTASIGSHPGFSPVGGLLGGLFAGGLTLLLARRLGGGPVHMVLIGMIINLGLNGLAAILLLFFENSLDGLYIWGAGNLHLHDYSLLWWIGTVLLLIFLGMVPLARSLDLFALGEERASSLGVAVKPIQIIALCAAVLLAALVCSVVGMISFVGLIAPHLASGCGARTSAQKALWSMAWGALILLGADVLARLLGGDNISVPAGALTTLLGAPCLLYFLRHRSKHAFHSPSKHTLSLSAPFRVHAGHAAVVLLALTSAGIACTLYQGDPTADSFALRLPRLLYAVCAGAGLAAAGLILQLFLRNPLASPDITGLTHSGVLCVVLAGVFLSGMSQATTITLSLLGSTTGLMIMLWLNRGAFFSPVRLALTGIALTAITSTATPIVFALSANQSTDALMWLSGTTYTATLPMALGYALLSLLLMATVWLTWRAMNLLQLGNQWAISLGLNLQRARLLLLLIASAFSGLAVALVGGITFIGLMAPHAARLLGLSNHQQLIPITLLLGACLMVWADLAAQTLMHPYELPAGLLVSLLGGLYFIGLMSVGIRIQK
ncbi:MAG: hypothetical protein CMK83_17260 [Pseudomonadales bacterium]|nr:hypothetical protein [Pseudomonadales bacterium]MEC8813245.1 iron ABC transporter permease [Pseudomonadota bacterium]TNC89354.1 MAG: hypothetical protein CSH49_07645 [Alcanivorax sp.]HAG96438.1 hypothetical protein [Gammaproteobacteria bacterium]MAQ25956.1 hypothetical protein [Pseudomonadales bacterium]|tara:strand:- start:43400 stop:45331 length:1932 start_codon:yes stop_codon:yes gene_type:complete